MNKRNMSYGEFFLSVLLFVSLMGFLAASAISCEEREAPEQTIKVKYYGR